MDDVPYEFIERVFAKLSCRTIEKMVVPAPPLWQELWLEVARVYKGKIHSYECVIRPSEDGLYYGFRRFYAINEEPMTLEEFAKLDWRYHRVVELNIDKWKSRQQILLRLIWGHVRGGRYPIHRPLEDFHMVGERLVEILGFVSQFNLEKIRIQATGDQIRRALNECSQQDWQTEALTFESPSGSDAFLLKQVQSDRLVELKLCGPGDERLQPPLEAFVCRPKFRSLDSRQFQCFDFGGIERILAYWRSMDVPWTMAQMIFGGSEENRDQICNKLAWMERPNPVLQEFEEIRGDFKVVVKNCREIMLVEFKYWK